MALLKFKHSTNSYMDIRTTLSVNENFMEMLLDCKDREVKAEMILDSTNGLVRIEGFIREIYPNDQNPYLNLQSGIKVLVKTIIALNGVFSPEFSEC